MRKIVKECGETARKMKTAIKERWIYNGLVCKTNKEAEERRRKRKREKQKKIPKA